MAYSPTYTADDTSSIFVDGLATVLVVGVSFATLIGLVLLWKWFKKNK